MIEIIKYTLDSTTLQLMTIIKGCVFDDPQNNSMVMIPKNWYTIDSPINCECNFLKSFTSAAKKSTTQNDYYNSTITRVLKKNDKKHTKTREKKNLQSLKSILEFNNNNKRIENWNVWSIEKVDGNKILIHDWHKNTMWEKPN